MTKLTWDNKEYLFGVYKGAIYSHEHQPMVWNGLIEINEKDLDLSNGEYFHDGVKYSFPAGVPSFGLDIRTASYPNILDESIVFDFSYVVLNEGGYFLHLVYNCEAWKLNQTFASLNSNSEFDPASFEITTTPNRADRYTYAHVVLDSRYVLSTVMTSIENILYGTDSTDPRMIDLLEILSIFETHAVLVVVDNGDGTWTATSGAEYLEMVDAVTYKITSPSAVYISDSTYVVSSW